MTVIEGLKRQRGSYKAVLTKLWNYAKEINEKSQPTVEEMRVRANRAHEILEKIVSVEASMLALGSQEESELIEAEEICYAAVAKFNEWINRRATDVLNTSTCNPAPEIKLAKLQIPLGVMVSPRANEPTRVQSPRTQVPHQPQFQCPEAIKRTNSPQSPNIIRSQNLRMSPQLAPMVSQHSVIVEQRSSSPSAHQTLLTTSGVISTQSQQSPQQRQTQTSNSGQTNIVINRVPVAPILTPVAQKSIGGTTNIMLQQAPSQVQKPVNVVLAQNVQKSTQPSVSISETLLSKVQSSIPQPTVVTYSTTMRVVPVTTSSQQVQMQQQQPKTIITTLPTNTTINQQIKQATINAPPKITEPKIGVNNTEQPSQPQVVMSQNQPIMFQQPKQLQPQQQQMFQHQKMIHQQQHQQHNFTSQPHVMLKQQPQIQQHQQLQQQKIVISTKPTIQQPAQSQNIMILQQSKLQNSVHVQPPQSMEKVQQPLQQTVQHPAAQSKEIFEPLNNRSHSSIIVCQNISKPPMPQISQASPVLAPLPIPTVQTPKTPAPQVVQSPVIDSLPLIAQPTPAQQCQPSQPTHQPPVQPPPPPMEPVQIPEPETAKPVIEKIVKKPSKCEEISPEPPPRENKDSLVVPLENTGSGKPIESPQSQIMEKPQEPKPQASQPPSIKLPKSLLTEENLTKLRNSPDDSIEQDSKEDSDYWSAKEVNIESVIKNVDALCSGEDTSEGSEITKEEWTEERISRPSNPLEVPSVNNPPTNWIVRGKDVAKKVFRRCVKCLKQNPRLMNQIMGELPEDRVKYTVLFGKVGIDFCGPFRIHPVQQIQQQMIARHLPPKINTPRISLTPPTPNAPQSARARGPRFSNPVQHRFTSPPQNAIVTGKQAPKFATPTQTASMSQPCTLVNIVRTQLKNNLPVKSTQLPPSPATPSTSSSQSSQSSSDFDADDLENSITAAVVSKNPPANEPYNSSQSSISSQDSIITQQITEESKKNATVPTTGRKMTTDEYRRLNQQPPALKYTNNRAVVNSSINRRKQIQQQHQIHASKLRTDLGQNSQIDETRNSAKLLVILENGEQRLITFTLPKESCTVQELLEQVGVQFSHETNIQCVSNPGANIDYVVTVGVNQDSTPTEIVAVDSSLQNTQIQWQTQYKNLQLKDIVIIHDNNLHLRNGYWGELLCYIQVMTARFAWLK